ncbi:helicase-related protein [Acetobacter fallax]|uniref:DNA helicase n=1 Tax=Acetobacter fallax TaxID=1737473 RepID=A0ABX0KC50_9PROT|nr:helicase-related protein [Acetobacter fallax]NHO31547.1 DNA helicase [Acetobacter fallax]NHO35106.1 DNA helicase [Acetobacter fallax]
MTGSHARTTAPRVIADAGSAYAPNSRDADAHLHAVLGPTNTGKTHYAIERMLAHPSGIIGFPLRLLARENYERMVAQKGAGRVGLITGEEKIIPPDAKWFSCTVEAMPVDRNVAFLAVDEIQLCADPERGHIFTSRLLHARGREETLFLGAETIAPLLRRLLPGITIDTRPRLSALTATGAIRLEKLPPRSAIVAFSAAELYAIAELIRTRRGGCAVVMGQMSPRTRNAQVALYQDREVDYLVATDAIGMGLNMDIAHVAFAGLSKFDGMRRRSLTAAEVAQIAGRAGRGTRDGTFGTTGRCPPIPEAIIEAVETHQFDPLECLIWRNDALDFTSPRALLASLSLPPPLRGLRASEPTSDALTLAALVEEPQVRTFAVGRTRTRQLWDVCQIPDFRKIGERSHAQLCARVFTLLVEQRRLPATWLEEQLRHFDRADGDVDTLMQRLAGIRIWSYIANRDNWVTNAPLWQERTRAVEDKVSDALHERLTARFVDRRSAHLIRLLENEDSAPLLSAVQHNGDVIVEGHSIGRMQGFTLHMDPTLPQSDRTTLARAARRAMRTEIPFRVSACCDAPDTAFRFDTGTGDISWKDAIIARLRPGRDILHPAIEIRGDDLLDTRQRERVKARLSSAFQHLVKRELAPLFRAEAGAVADCSARGLIHQLMEGAGQTPQGTMSPGRLLARLGVRIALGQLYLPSLLKPGPAKMRLLLLAVAQDIPPPVLPHPGAVSVPAGSFPSPLLFHLGWIPCGPVLLRIDMADRLSTELTIRARHTDTALRADFAPWLGVRTKDIPAVLKALGFRVTIPPPLPSEVYGPSPAWMLTRIRSRKPRRKDATISVREYCPDSPFAALATLIPINQPQ